MGRDGLCSFCRECAGKASKAKREANYEAYRDKEKMYKQENRELIRARGKVYSQNNKEKIAERKRKFRQNNREKLTAARLKYTSKPENKQRNRDYVNKKLHTDPQFKLARLLRSRLNNAVRAKGIEKVGSAVSDLGCTLLELKIYLESKFDSWMNWENHGMYDKNKDTWNLDHIIPLSKFNLENREEYLKACHYTNLQPLRARDNLIKNRF